MSVCWAARALIASLVGACTNIAGAPPPLDFEVAVGSIGDEITRVVADGRVFPVEGGRTTIRLSFPDYRTGTSRGPIEVLFLAGDQVRMTGRTAVGACEQTCVYEFCPDPDEIMLEYLHYPRGPGFEPNDYECFRCDDVVACP